MAGRLSPCRASPHDVPQAKDRSVNVTETQAIAATITTKAIAMIAKRRTV
jgi:hypothetical protein